MAARSAAKSLFALYRQCHNWGTYIEIAMKYFILSGASMIFGWALADSAIAANPAHIQRLLKTNQCSMCDLSGANLAEANLFGANLVNANLRGANLAGANLGSANLTDADLTGATLVRAYLHLAVLENTNLTQANLNGAYLKDAAIANITVSGANLAAVNLSRTNLVGTNLSGVDLRGANLSAALLSGMKAQGAIPNGNQMAILGSLAASKLICDVSYTQMASEGAGMLGLEWGTAQLAGANLSGANLSKALLVNGDLQKANLTGANLTGACLKGSKLHNAQLDQANLQNAALAGAILEGVNLTTVKNGNFEGAFRSEQEAKKQEQQAKAAILQTSVTEALLQINAVQEAHYLGQGQFISQWDDLDLDLPPETDTYRYQLVSAPDRPDRQAQTAVIAIPKTNDLKAYVGIVAISQQNQEFVSVSIVCESQQPTQSIPTLPQYRSSEKEITCPIGFVLTEKQ